MADGLDVHVSPGGAEVFSGAARALAAVIGGGEMLRDMADALGKVAEKAADEVAGNASQLPHPSIWPTRGVGLGATVAQAVRSETNVRGDQAVASVIVDETPQARDFRHAPRALEAAGGWDHPIFGRGRVHQVGIPGFASGPVADRDDDAADAIVDIMEATARRAESRMRS